MIKNVPDRAFRDEHRERWATMNLQEDSKLDPMSGRRWIVVATFSADALGTPFVDELALVSTDKHWLLDDTGVPRRIPPVPEPRAGAGPHPARETETRAMAEPRAIRCRPAFLGHRPAIRLDRRPEQDLVVQARPKCAEADSRAVGDAFVRTLG